MPPLSPTSRPQPGYNNDVAVLLLESEAQWADSVGQTIWKLAGDSPARKICSFDLQIAGSSLTRYLREHKFSIIIDSTRSGMIPGQVCIVELKQLLERFPRAQINSCHADSLLDDLRDASVAGELHDGQEVYFFGIEANEGESLSKAFQDSLISIGSQLSSLIRNCVSRSQDEH